MFGQNNPSPFGSPPGQPTGFGSAAPAFGSPPAAPFGTQQPSSGAPFGGGSAFGSPPAPSGFGATGFGSSAPTGFGTTSAFGAQPQQPGTSTFGGGFGSSAPAFGAAAPSAGLFGSAPAPAGGGLFGGGGATGGFGSSTPSTFGSGGLGGGTGFGATSTFGAATTTPSTSLFGQPSPTPAFGTSTFGAPNTSGFGTSPPGGLFGAPAPAPAGAGLFGAPSTGVGGGSKVAPYQATTRQDGTTSIQLHAITAMQQYEGKSFEELRYEDYAQGNKGTGGGVAGAATGAFGGFGAPAPGMFGSTAPAPAPFGAPASAFGAAAPAPAFGMSGSTFGAAPAPAPTAFGAPSSFGAPSTGLFGAQAPAPAFGGFGAAAPKPAGMFGSPSPAPAPGTGLFGQAPAPSMFGGAAPAPAPTGLFGSTPAPAPGLFGGAPSFGSPAPAPMGGMFGAPQPAPAGGLFGAPAPAPLFGQQAPAPAFGGSSLFGGQAPSPGGGLFGPPKPQGTGLFGAPAPGGGLFGAPAPASNYYGAAPTPAAPQYYSSVPVNIAAPLASEVLAQQMAAMENQRKDLEKLDVWRGKSPDVASIVPASLAESEANTILPYRGYARPYSASPKSQTQIRPRGFNTLSAAKSPPQLSLTPHGNSNNERVMMSPSTMVTSSVKRLVIRPESLTPKPKLRLQFEDSPRDLMNGQASTETPTLKLPPTTAPASSSSTAPEPGARHEEESHDRQSSTPSTATSPGFDYYQRIVAAPDEAGGGTSATPDNSNGRPPSSTQLPKLTKIGYDVSPTMEQLKAMSEADLAAVPNFTVSHAGFGKVEWEGAVDVRGVDLDYVVKIEQGECSVYMADEENGTKPPQGTKLNRPAIITLWNVLPKDGCSPESFIRKINKVTAKLEADLISYDIETGEWIFRVKHFSRYGIFDSDDDDDIEGDDQLKSHYGGVGGPVPRTPEKGADNDEDDDHVAYVSDVDMSETIFPAPTPMKQADKAYEALSKMIEEADISVDDDVVSAQRFADEVEPPAIRTRTQHGVYPSDYDFPVSWTGVTSKIKAKAQLKATATATDASLRFGRSFGVCWHPDGSFFRPSPTLNGFVPLLVRSRPTFANRGADQGLSNRLLETQLASSVKAVSSEGPLYTLPAGFANSGTESSHKALSRAIVEFSAQSYTQNQEQRRSDPEDVLVGHRAFELLSCVVDTNDGDDASTDVSKRLEAVSKWIIDACEYDVDTCIESAKQRKDVAAAIFAAVSGGDLEKASSIASNNGFLHLASLLMVGQSGIDDMRYQVSEWRKNGISQKIPEPLLKVYSLLGGELELSGRFDGEEQSQLDWRRHFALRLLFAGGSANLSEVIHKFASDVQAAAVVYPYPRYSRNNSQGKIGEYQTECTLYRLLQLLDRPSQGLLSHLVQPNGHADSVHNFALAFHLAATLSAMGICCQLTALEEARLVDAYSAQLFDKGNWEWAVFVQLCSLTTSSADNPRWRLRQAKEIVLSNFCPTHPRSKAIQSFLETKLGVPHAWFEEALALRCAANGDVLGYVLHASSFSMDNALQTLERVFLPNLFFMTSGDIEASMKLLQACDSYGSPLAEALIDFFELSNDVRRISQSTREVVVDHLPFLLETARDIETTLVSYQAKAKTLSPLSFNVYPDYRMVPMEAFLAEATAGLSLLKLQLRALEVNLPIPGITQATPLESFTSLDLVNSEFSDEKILRGYIDGQMQS